MKWTPSSEKFADELMELMYETLDPEADAEYKPMKYSSFL